LHSSHLKVVLKQNLLSAPANALKMCLHYHNTWLFYLNVHKLTNRATPLMYSCYKCTLQLYKLFNADSLISEWCHLNFEIINTSRQKYFKIRINNKLKIGNTILCNRLHQLNDEIPINWLNLSFANFKIKCKSKFLTYIWNKKLILKYKNLNLWK
jgi:hypothetical protein